MQITHVDIQKGKLLGNMIDPETGLGPLSAEIIAGTQDLYAPRCFQLKNEVIMQMRSEKKCTALEHVSGRQKSGETEPQKNARLAVFSMSAFPKIESSQ